LITDTRYGITLRWSRWKIVCCDCMSVV